MSQEGKYTDNPQAFSAVHLLALSLPLKDKQLESSKNVVSIGTLLPSLPSARNGPATSFQTSEVLDVEYRDFQQKDLIVMGSVLRHCSHQNIQ